MKNRIYIGTILLEPNRWSPGRLPSYPVSEWLDRFARDGFDGLELWENHAALCPAAELARLEQARLPIAVFNSYAGLDADQGGERERSAGLANRLKATAVKFNLGRDRAAGARYAGNALAWAQTMPQVARMLCECHAGTIMEDPATAQAIYATWDDGRFQAIVHPCGMEEEQMLQMLRRLGPRIVTHAHVALGGHTPEKERAAQRRIRLLQDLGFAGSFTLEFTEGTGAGNENREAMYGRALRDLEFLRKMIKP